MLCKISFVAGMLCQINFVVNRICCRMLPVDESMSVGAFINDPEASRAKFYVLRCKAAALCRKRE
jgi:hypothetical protein